MKKTQLLTQEETKQVSGGAANGAMSGASTITNGLSRVLEAAGLGVEGLTRPSPTPKDGNLCCSNSRRI
ncbi:hypothetical protein HRJ45_06940 [Vibrio coralliilyticus]|uniref:Uncharacterized protein n=1 Tax=Vibrio coralliilyticus TaxID=190893 RepID=A0AAP7DER5_9VIBR|nr:hypothetical protein [Vibrio coralliilyticus]ANW23727.1 hypothetical protein BA953_05550 [Vibrio coralliilyticus]NOJ24476.1 hypothetical protein [Vibrio coralliilyticus]NRF24403.1 hypothetical protein [Vibrio coralliilyticus]NRF78831.1 hypothetical protein [Vibrio coralliilyticus]